MTDLYLDNDVAIRLADILAHHGHSCRTTRDEGLSAAGDYLHLLHAAQRGWTLITHNKADFRLLHDAWQALGTRWDCHTWQPHSGILIPEQILVEEYAPAIVELLASGADLRNRLREWTRARGWEERALQQRG